MRKITLSLIISFISLFSYAQQNAQAVSHEQKIADSLYQLSDFTKALQLYEKVVKQTTNNAIVWNRLGYCYHNAGKYTEALQCYEKSLANNPAPLLKQFVEARMSRIYSQQKDNVKAIDHLKNAVTLGYSNLSELET